MSLDLAALGAAVARRGALVRIVVTGTAGSVPRGAGTSMLVGADWQDGTIGGGALEFEAVAAARALLRDGGPGTARTLPLGPGLGQCCGGSVALAWERFDASALPTALPHARALGGGAGPMPEAVRRRAAAMAPGAAPTVTEGWLIEAAPATARPLWIWGAGHVGRALVAVLAPLPTVAIVWVDTAADRFPAALPDGVTQAVAADPALLASRAPTDADHLILTYAHDLDLALCDALLTRGFASCGLIGSATKWARFRNRLARLGHSPARISCIACPIGDPGLGKHPQAIAVGVAVALLSDRGQIVAGERAG